MTKLEIKRTEEWLDERLVILQMTNNQADVSYYNGALAAVEYLGLDWEVKDGKHKLYK